MIGQAVTEASLLLRDKVVAIAAHLLEASPDDLEVAEGIVSVKGTPTKSVPVQQVAWAAYQQSGTLPPELDRTLEVVHRSVAPDEDVVERRPRGDRRGRPRHREGRDPALRGVGGLRPHDQPEHRRRPGATAASPRASAVCSTSTTSTTTTATRWRRRSWTTCCPPCTRSPTIDTFHIESPAATVGGYKGVGEGGAIAAPAAVFNAVADALAQHGVIVTDQPLDPDTVVRAITEAIRG